MYQKVLNRIKHYLQDDNVELLVKKNADGKHLKLTIVKHLQSGISENIIVKRNPDCVIRNTYRNGRKTGMQITSFEVFKQLPIEGDPADHPLKRLSATSDFQNDTA